MVFVTWRVFAEKICTLVELVTAKLWGDPGEKCIWLMALLSLTSSVFLYPLQYRISGVVFAGSVGRLTGCTLVDGADICAGWWKTKISDFFSPTIWYFFFSFVSYREKVSRDARRYPPFLFHSLHHRCAVQPRLIQQPYFPLENLSACQSSKVSLLLSSFLEKFLMYPRLNCCCTALDRSRCSGSLVIWPAIGPHCLCQ